jgi:hypothetical protein
MSLRRQITAQAEDGSVHVGSSFGADARAMDVLSQAKVRSTGAVLDSAADAYRLFSASQPRLNSIPRPTTRSIAAVSAVAKIRETRDH